jgi:hypothetical protein
MTQTATSTTFPIELVNLDDMKQFHLAEKHCFSLLTYNRVRIEAADASVVNDNMVNMSRSEVRRLHSFLSDLDAKGEVRADPIFDPMNEVLTNPDGTTFEKLVMFAHSVGRFYTDQHEFHFWSDRRVSIENFHCSDQHIHLDQAEVIQLLNWLQELYSVKQDLH